MKSQIPWVVILVWIGVEPSLTGVALAQNAASSSRANPPIVLHYRETPIYLGPHEHDVTAIAFSADGKMVATGATDGYLRLWDVATGRLRSIHGEDATRGVHGLAFSPDGRFVAVVGGLFAKEAVLWDTTTGRIAREFEEPHGGATATSLSPDAPPFIYKGKPVAFRVRTALAFSPDGRILATAPDAVVLRDARSGSVLATLEQPTKGVNALAFSPDGKTLATAANDRKVRLWSVPAGELKTTLDGPTRPLTSVAISPDGMRVAATSSGSRSLLDRTVVSHLWWWVRSGGPVRRIEIGNVGVRQLAFTSPTTVVVGASRELLSLDLQGSDPPHPRKIWSHSGNVLAIAVSPNRRLVASGGADRTVDIVDLSTGELVHRLPGLTDVFCSVAASNDGERFATATTDFRFSHRATTKKTSFTARYKEFFAGEANAGRMQPSQVRIWSARDGQLESIRPLPASQVTSIDFVPHSDQLIVAGWDPEKGGTLSLWDAGAGKRVRDFSAQSAEVLSIAVSPDGGTLASGNADGNVDLWDVQSAAKKRSHKHDHPVRAVAFSADGQLLATGDANRTVRVFDASSDSIVRTMKSRSPLVSLDFSPDATFLAAGTRVPGLELWNMHAGTASRTLRASGDHFDRMPGFVAFSPDGRFVVCGGHGKDIAIFETATGTLHCELRGHIHPATAIAFLPDGRLVSGGEARSVRLWDPDLGRLLATWIAVPADGRQNWPDEWVGFTPSGRFVGSACLDRLVGWQTAGDVIIGQEDGNRRRRVENLLQADSSLAPARD